MEQNGIQEKNDDDDDDSARFEKCSKRHCAVFALAQSFNLKNTDLKNVKVSEALSVRFVQYRI